MPRILSFPRIEDHHQRATQQHQTTRGGDDADGVLPDGVRALRPAGLHGCAQEQMREVHPRERDRRGVESVSRRASFVLVFFESERECP